MRGHRQKRPVFTFVATGATGLPQKRKQTHHACQDCRKRKRRCTHQESPIQLSELEMMSPAYTSTDAMTPLSSLGSKVADTTTSTTDNTDAVIQEQPACGELERGSRFIGDLNPEGTLLAAASPSGSAGTARQHDVGVWFSDKSSRGSGGFSRLAVKKSRSRFISSPDPLISSVFLPHLEDHCLSVLPSPDNLAGLTHIYLEHIHPIFPILDYETYQNTPSDSPEWVLLSQTICFAASVSPNSIQYLHLPKMDVSSRNEFSRTLFGVIRTSLALGLVKDKTALIQVFAIISLFTQFSGDRQESAEFFSRALAHAHTMGLHLHGQSNSPSEANSIRLFCCMYALDILNAAFHGRPMQMHARDFGRDLHSCIAAQQGCFRLFLRTITLMDRVIELYRPSTNAVWEDGFPLFEDVLEEFDALSIPMHLTVAILSCRSISPGDCSRSSASYLRQSLSALRVTTIVGDEFRNALSLFPIVPYAVSQSLRVSYRSLQQSKTSFFRSRARKQVALNCDILRDLGEIYHSASLIADLGEHLLRGSDTHQGPGIQTDAAARQNPELRASSTQRTTESASIDFQNAPSTDSSRPTYQPYHPNLFNPMSSLDIFENLEHELDVEAIVGGLFHGSV
ncbi:Transcription factor, fungi [Penicillium camemberti]|uniref:Transcription factor, fungi n=1 Tax=Penicillium camemberti (strain FM 013) TaxID=1429867 RepID=A0A0G4PQL4_PENC3|nr:Transcription factor, fungi [Penicillium camemberti]